MIKDTQTTETMQSTNNQVITALTDQVTKENFNLKFANMSLIVIEAYKNRESFSFEGFRETRYLFKRDSFTGDFKEILSYSELAINTESCRRYNEMHKIRFDTSISCPAFKELKRAVSFLQKNWENNWSIFARIFKTK